MSLDLAKAYRYHNAVAQAIEARCTARFEPLPKPCYMTLEDHGLSKDGADILATVRIWYTGGDYETKYVGFPAVAIQREARAILGQPDE